jgi:type VI secretion system protein ImpH
VTGKFRLTLGPIDYATYRRFLPDGEDHTLLRSLVRFYVTDYLDTDVELNLMGPEVPPLELNPDDPPRLGWTTWLKTQASPDVSNVFSMRNN